MAAADAASVKLAAVLGSMGGRSGIFENCAPSATGDVLGVETADAGGSLLLPTGVHVRTVELYNRIP